MAYDRALEERIRGIVDGWEDLTAKKMFGGVCYLHRGNMMCGIWQDALIVRVGLEGFQEALDAPHAGPFEVTGRPMAGWVMVGPRGIEGDRDLAAWLQKARAFVRTLPAKRAKEPKPRMTRRR
jgi:hypothetical protein